MGNTTVKWMTLYRQAQKAHKAEIESLTKEYDDKLLAYHIKNKWLSDKLINTQRDLRVLTLKIAMKEVEIHDLQQQLRRIKKLGGSAKKKAIVKASVTSSAGSESGDCT